MNRRGMQVILDGVFNHASSDGLYFDRYHRYPTRWSVRIAQLDLAELVPLQRQQCAVQFVGLSTAGSDSTACRRSITPTPR